MSESVARREDVVAIDLVFAAIAADLVCESDA